MGVACSSSNIITLSLRFNGHFPGEPGLAGVYWSKGWWRWWWHLDCCSYKLCKAPVKSSPPTNQHPVSFTVWMPFLSPNQQCQSTEGEKSHSMDLLTPSSPRGLPTLSLTTNSSWLRWGRVAMPLISPLTPVPHNNIITVIIIVHRLYDHCMGLMSDRSDAVSYAQEQFQIIEGNHAYYCR